MKCVRHYVNEKDVKRVSNKKAEELVSTGVYKYCPKKVFKRLNKR